MGTRGYTRRNSKADANQPLIVETFRKAGATVAIIEEPMDLLIGYCGIDQVVEVKNPDGKRKNCELNEEQEKFQKNWKGRRPVVVTTPEEAIDVLAEMMTGNY